MSKEDVILYVPTQNLKDAAKDYKVLLKDLVDAGLIKSFKEMVAFTVTRDKAIHIQTILAGYYDAPTIPVFQQPIKGDK